VPFSFHGGRAYPLPPDSQGPLHHLRRRHDREDGGSAHRPVGEVQATLKEAGSWATAVVD
jgi:hypothetical protein